MNTIDQRILIPANPDVIWGIISNINDNPKWLVNCQNISFLTTNHTGQGMRYRNTHPKGRDYVVEITAWYENVGYAYKIIDGISTRSNSGRLRLQEITEGTIVQWVFEYEPSGLLGGIKDSLGTKRNFEREIIQSLENLWTLVKEIQAGKPYISRTAMREAPDVETRAQYKSRHDSKRPDEVGASSSTDALSKFLQLDEPAIKQDDTRPHPAEPTPPSGMVPVVSTDIFSKKSTPTNNEPDFLQSLDTPADADTSAHSIFQPPTLTEVVEDQTPAITPEPADKSVSESLFSFEKPEPTPEPIFSTSIFDDPVVETPAETKVVEAELVENEAVKTTEEVVETTKAVEAPVELPISTDTSSEKPITPATPIIEPVIKDSDSSQMSIFEIFGLPKPSETQQMPAVVIEQPAETTPVVEMLTSSKVESAVEAVSSSVYDEAVGLRVKFRRKNTKIRKR